MNNNLKNERPVIMFWGLNPPLPEIFDDFHPEQSSNLQGAPAKLVKITS